MDENLSFSENSDCYSSNEKNFEHFYFKKDAENSNIKQFNYDSSTKDEQISDNIRQNQANYQSFINQTNQNFLKSTKVDQNNKTLLKLSNSSQQPEIIKKKPKSYEGKNFTKIFGNLIFNILQLKNMCMSREIIYDLFKKCKKEIKDEDVELSYQKFVKKIIEEKYGYKYKTIKFFQYVWMDENSSDHIFIKEISKYFLEKIAINYFISNQFTKIFTNLTDMNKYLEFIPVFIRGIYDPEHFDSLERN